jgi:hypothetical protein
VTLSEFRGELRALTCVACGVVFGMVTTHLRDVSDKGLTIFCLNGHGQKIRLAAPRDTEREALLEQVKTLREALGQRTTELEHWELEAGRLLEENDKFREARGKPLNFFDK